MNFAQEVCKVTRFLVCCCCFVLPHRDKKHILKRILRTLRNVHRLMAFKLGAFQGIISMLLLLLLSCFSRVLSDRSPPGSPVPGILQARRLEWVAISFSNAWKWKVKVKSLSRVWLLATPWTAAYQAPPSMGFSRQEYWSGVPLPSLWYGSHVLRKRIIYYKWWFQNEVSIACLLSCVLSSLERSSCGLFGWREVRDGEGERWEDVGSGLNFALVAGSLGGTGGQMESPVFACQDRCSFF